MLSAMDLTRVTRTGVVAPVHVDPSGRTGPTRAQSRGPSWRRTSRGRYVPAEVDATTPWQRIVEAAATLPSGGAVTGWAALNWMGARWFEGLEPDGRTPRPVPLALGDNRGARPRAGVVLSEAWLDPTEAIEVDGLPLTVPARSACFEIQSAPSLTAAVAVADMVAFSDLASIEEIGVHAGTFLAGRPLSKRIGRALELADENSWSPRESRMRLAWMLEGGFPRPLSNVPVFGPGGRHLFTADLLDPDHGVVGEYDGLVHLEDGRRARDVNREDLVRDLGFEIVTMVRSDGSHRRAFLERLEHAYRRASTRRRSDGWTLDQPEWWVDTSSVAARRALSDSQRQRWLRRQVA